MIALLHLPARIGSCWRLEPDFIARYTLSLFCEHHQVHNLCVPLAIDQGNRSTERDDMEASFWE